MTILSFPKDYLPLHGGDSFMANDTFSMTLHIQLKDFLPSHGMDRPFHPKDLKNKKDNFRVGVLKCLLTFNSKFEMLFTPPFQRDFQKATLIYKLNSLFKNLF